VCRISGAARSLAQSCECAANECCNASRDQWWIMRAIVCFKSDAACRNWLVVSRTDSLVTRKSQWMARENKLIVCAGDEVVLNNSTQPNRSVRIKHQRLAQSAHSSVTRHWARKKWAPKGQCYQKLCPFKPKPPAGHKPYQNHLELM